MSEMITNKFGTDMLHDEQDIEGTIYAKCCACMSIYAEFLSWANAHPGKMVKSAENADNIVVLSCQVTDLAVLNDLRTLESLRARYPDKNFYIGGCLARRFDIPIPAKRLRNIKTDFQDIEDKTLVDFQKPFWIKDFKEGDGPGNLFRDSYPLRIGVGCSNACKYCTIRHTRGEPYQLPAPLLEKEFLSHENVVLIADSPTADQVKDWCAMAIKHGKAVSFRNVEPHIAMEALGSLVVVRYEGLLKALHVPIQAYHGPTLIDMGRSPDDVDRFLAVAQGFRQHGVYLATNIIIDYKNFPNPKKLDRLFDHVAWNPYWGGVWDAQIAEEKFEYYLG